MALPRHSETNCVYCSVVGVEAEQEPPSVTGCLPEEGEPYDDKELYLVVEGDPPAPTFRLLAFIPLRCLVDEAEEQPAPDRGE
jgi:hypothetical protein